MTEYDNVTDLLKENVQTVLQNLPADRMALEVLDAAEAEDRNRKMVRRAIAEALAAVEEAEAEAIPEPAHDWPTHRNPRNGRMQCLVPRYRRAGDEIFHFVIGPLRDIHPLVLEQVRGRLKSSGGDLCWMDPYKCDEIEWEGLPAAENSVAPGVDQVMQYGSKGERVSDSELLARW